MSFFRVALGADFRDEQGNALYPDFDLTSLDVEPGLTWEYASIGDRGPGNLDRGI